MKSNSNQQTLQIVVMKKGLPLSPLAHAKHDECCGICDIQKQLPLLALAYSKDQAAPLAVFILVDKINLTTLKRDVFVLSKHKRRLKIFACCKKCCLC